MDSEDNEKAISARQTDDDPRPGFYHAHREVEFDYIMARDRQKYAEEKYKNLKRKYTVLGMSLRKVTLLRLGSKLVSVTDLKRIQTPHSLCCDFGGYKTFTTR